MRLTRLSSRTQGGTLSDGSRGVWQPSRTARLPSEENLRYLQMARGYYIAEEVMQKGIWPGRCGEGSERDRVGRALIQLRAWSFMVAVEFGRVRPLSMAQRRTPDVMFDVRPTPLASREARTAHVGIQHGITRRSRARGEDRCLASLWAPGQSTARLEPDTATRYCEAKP